MTEAWFLFDQDAIRSAAGNPRGRNDLNLPTHAEAARRADPKEILEEALVAASESSGRRLAEFRRDLAARKKMVSEKIENFSPLMVHDSFRRFYDETGAVLRDAGFMSS